MELIAEVVVTWLLGIGWEFARVWQFDTMWEYNLYKNQYGITIVSLKFHSDRVHVGVRTGDAMTIWYWFEYCNPNFIDDLERTLK